MPCFLWTQGETDQQDRKTGEWYKEKMRALIQDIDADAKAVTGQKNDVLALGKYASPPISIILPRIRRIIPRLPWPSWIWLWKRTAGTS